MWLFFSFLRASRGSQVTLPDRGLKGWTKQGVCDVYFLPGHYVLYCIAFPYHIALEHLARERIDVSRADS